MCGNASPILFISVIFKTRFLTRPYNHFHASQHHQRKNKVRLDTISYLICNLSTLGTTHILCVPNYRKKNQSHETQTIAIELRVLEVNQSKQGQKFFGGKSSKC